MKNISIKKKTLFLFLSALFFHFAFAQDFNLNYQYLIDYDKEKFLIKIKNFEKNDFFICFLNNFECQKTNSLKLDNSLLSQISDKKFVSQDLNLNVYLKKIKKNNFIFVENKTNGQIKFLNLNFIPEKVFFSKDKNKILFYSKQNFYIVSLDTNQIFKLKTKISGTYFTSSPSLKFLAFYKPSYLSTGERKYYVFDLSQDKLINFFSEKVNYWDLLTENNKIFEFIDDNKLLFLNDKDNFQNLYIYQINDNKIERLFNKNFIIKDFFVDGNKIYFVANKDNPLIWNLYEYDLRSKNLKILVKNVAYDFNIFKLNNFIVFKKIDEFPPKIGIYDLLTQQEKYFKLNYPQEKIKSGEIRNFENLWFIEYLPENFNQKDLKLIIWLHGGPHRQTSLTFHPYISYGFFDYLLEKLRQEGYFIIKLDYPGSFGYGRNFAESIKNNIGKIDVESVIKIINYEKQKYNIKKVYLVGISYGGYLALKTLYENPNLIDGAISINGVTDWWLLIKRNPNSIFKIHFNGTPNQKNKHLYDQASIFLNKDNFKDKKIMIIYGLDDGSVPVYQQLFFIEKYFNIAKIEEKAYNEKHTFQKQETFVDLLKSISNFIKD